MNRTNLLVALATIGFVVQIPDTYAADGASPEGAPKPQLQAKFFQQKTPYDGEVTRGVITAATNQFSFVIPNGFRKKAEIDGKTVALTSTGQTALLTFRIFEHAVDGKHEIKADVLRASALGRFKDARVADEFTAYVESMSGPGFEIEWTGQAGKMVSRVAFVPFANGHLEFVMQSSAAEIRSFDGAFSSFLTMIRSSPIGQKLPMVEFPSEL